jgi:hypothetical protein
MRNIILILFLLVPALSPAQTLKINAGATMSTIIPPEVTRIPTGVKNVLIGSIASIGVDYTETKWGFLSSNIGFVQKGRRNEVIYTDALGNEINTATVRIRYNYATLSTTMNFKLSQSSLIPFFSIGPRVDYLLNQKDFYDPKEMQFAFGLNGGFGLLKRFNKIELGAKIDYLLNLAKLPKDRTGAIQVFYGYKFK